jgi:hypothetical protein
MLIRSPQIVSKHFWLDTAFKEQIVVRVDKVMTFNRIAQLLKSMEGFMTANTRKPTPLKMNSETVKEGKINSEIMFSR